MPQASFETKQAVERILGFEPDDGLVWNVLHIHGFTEDEFVIRPPVGRVPTDDEWELISYLVEEWDWGYEGRV